MNDRFQSDGYATAGENNEPDKASTLVGNAANAQAAVLSQVTESSPTVSYWVLVDDNYHYMDADERWTLGHFETLADAIAACKQLVDECLGEYYQPGITAEALYSLYTSFGEDPYIVGSNQRVPFSAWDYAKQRCIEMAGTTPEVGKG